MKLNDQPPAGDSAAAAAGSPGLAPAAKRALEEAEKRRRERKPRPAPEPETGGPGGPEPTRYGDWEKGGLISDF